MASFNLASVPASVTSSAPAYNQAKINWAAATDTGGSGLAGYKVYRNGSATALANVTAAAHGTANEIQSRLVDQVTSSVRWEESMRYLLAQGFTRFIELGPGKALSGFMKRIEPGVQMLNVADVGSLDATVKTLAEPVAK